jgi:predicted ABC-type ATPase
LILVLAGVNGAGKSSVGGANLRANGQDWYNPDEIAREMQLRFPERQSRDIDGQVWREGLNRLRHAIRTNTNFAFETTLGGNSITVTLLDAIAVGVPVWVWYCGLGSPELHIDRVAARVARGGHDIPEHKIRERYASSMRNLCRLAPGLDKLAVYDNSMPLGRNGLPDIRELVSVENGKIMRLDTNMPDWAKPVAAVCLQHFE